MTKIVSDKRRDANRKNAAKSAGLTRPLQSGAPFPPAAVRFPPSGLPHAEMPFPVSSLQFLVSSECHIVTLRKTMNLTKKKYFRNKPI